MKNLYAMLVGSALMITTAHAKQLTIDGQQSQYRTQLSTSVSHTEYRTEYRETTCSREVLDGYREVCRWVPGDTTCHTVGGGQNCGLTPSGRQCFDVPGREVCETSPGYQDCDRVPEYRTEYYSCTQPVQIPYTVKDYDLENDVVVNVARNQQLPKGVSEVLDLSQNGNSTVITSVKSTAKVIVLASQKTEEVSNTGLLKRVRTTVNVQLVDRSLALGAFLSPVTLAIQNKALVVTSGLIRDVNAVTYELDLRRNKFLGKDEVVIQRALTQAEVSLAQNGSQTIATIDFQKLGILDRIDGKKIEIDLRLKSNLNLDQVVNRQDIPAGIGETKELDTRLN